jgi:hypothetical protein
MAWIDLYPVLMELDVEYALVCPARFGRGGLAQGPSTATGSPITTNCPKSMAFHPSKQDMIFVLPLDEGRPIEQDEQSEHLSH